MNLRARLRSAARIVFINCVVLVALAVVVLVGVETYLRFSMAPSSGGSIFEHTLATPRYKVMKRNHSITVWGVELRTNNLGFRDDRLAVPEKQPDAFRIIVLGDSFTVSAGVEYEKIFTRLLEDTLRATWPQTEVLNLAVGGYNVLQYRMVLEEVGLALDPDMVVVAIFPQNDFNNNTYRANDRAAHGMGKPSRPPSWYKALYVYRAYLHGVEGKLRGMFATPSAGKPRELVEKEWSENLDALGAIASIAEEHALPVAVVMLPHIDFDNPRDQRAKFERVSRYLERERIPYLDLLQSFVASGVSDSSLHLNPLDWHPNEKYNRMVAEPVAAYLAQMMPGKENMHSGAGD